MKCVIFRGIPGAGKSTLASRLQGALASRGSSAKIVCADDFFMKDGTYHFDVSQLEAAHAACLTRFLKAVEKKDEEFVFVTNTNMSSWEISPYYQGAIAFGYHPLILSIEVDPQVAFHRNVHDVPQRTVERMHNKMEGLFDGFREEDRFPPHWKHEKVMADLGLDWLVELVLDKIG